MDSSKKAVTTITAKAATAPMRWDSTIATLKLDAEEYSTSSDGSASNRRITVVLTQAEPETSDQWEVNQLIDFLMDNNILFYPTIVNLCMLPLEQRHAILKLTPGIKQELQGK